MNSKMNTFFVFENFRKLLSQFLATNSANVNFRRAWADYGCRNCFDFSCQMQNSSQQILSQLLNSIGSSFVTLSPLLSSNVSLYNLPVIPQVYRLLIASINDSESKFFLRWQGQKGTNY